MRVSFDEYSSNKPATNTNTKIKPYTTRNAKMNNYNDPIITTATATYHSHLCDPIPQFSIQQVDEYEDLEEKMHSPRTPYGFMQEIDNKNNNTKQAPFEWNVANNLDRTISASSFESVPLDETINAYTPTLSATPSMAQLGALGEPMYSINSPSGSPEQSPLSSPKSTLATKTNSNSKAFGDTQRESSLQAIAAALSKVQTTRSKLKSFKAYKHGLGTYSNGNNSECNTTGTATPNSCSSQMLEGIVGSEYSFEADMNDLESERSDREETPVPIAHTIHSEEQETDTPLPIFSQNGFGLAQISEDVETQSVEEKESEEESKSEISDGESSIYLSSRFEDEIVLKGSRFESSRVLFLDVDGVLLSSVEQQNLGKNENIKFNDDVTALMMKLCRETGCDIVISSTWQFYKESHLKWLCRYLVACGWKESKIHTLLDLLPSHASADGIVYGREWYEESPYCRCRARGIRKIVSMYAQYISAWCALDDLPLHSGKNVCIPKAEDIECMVGQLSEAYFKPFEWRAHEKLKLMRNIKQCVRYAITKLNNCLFGSNSYRFGYEYDQTMIYYQADAIFKSCSLSYDIKDNAAMYQLVIQNMMAVVNQYVSQNLTYQGDPFIAPYLIQTDQRTGITPQNIENAITLLTYSANRNDTV